MAAALLVNWRRGFRRLAVAGWGFGLALLLTAAATLDELHRPLENVCASDGAADFPECIVASRVPLAENAGAIRRWQRRVLEYAAPEPVDSTRVVPRWHTETYRRALRRTALAVGVWTAWLLAALGVMEWVARGFEGGRDSR